MSDLDAAKVAILDQIRQLEEEKKQPGCSSSRYYFGIPNTIAVLRQQLKTLQEKPELKTSPLHGQSRR